MGWLNHTKFHRAIHACHRPSDWVHIDSNNGRWYWSAIGKWTGRTKVNGKRFMWGPYLQNSRNDSGQFIGGQNLEFLWKYARTFERKRFDFLEDSPEIFSIPKEPKSHNSDAFGTSKPYASIIEPNDRSEPSPFRGVGSDRHFGGIEKELNRRFWRCLLVISFSPPICAGRMFGMIICQHTLNLPTRNLRLEAQISIYLF